MGNDTRIDTSTDILKGQVSQSNVTGTTIGEKRCLDVYVRGFEQDSGVEGNRIHILQESTTDVANIAKEIFSDTVGGSVTRELDKIIVTTRAAGVFEILLNSTKVGSGRTNASNLNVQFEYQPTLLIPSGATITVEFTLLHGKSGQPVEVYLMGTDL